MNFRSIASALVAVSLMAFSSVNLATASTAPEPIPILTDVPAFNAPDILPALPVPIAAAPVIADAGRFTFPTTPDDASAAWEVGARPGNLTA